MRYTAIIILMICIAGLIQAQACIDTNIKTFEIDSFKTNTLPFRPIGPPFFNYTKNIIKYALETNDSISTQLQDFGDSLQKILNSSVLKPGVKTLRELKGTVLTTS
jgi:hypothetical protein